MAQRPPLSLTAELEKLEQSITLTLQEIDHNFSKTHRIVTTSIIPTVERYAKESEAVWEGSKFWKQFFEASANVALSNYQEEEVSYVDQTTESTTRGETYATHESSEFPNSSPGHYEERSVRPGPSDDTTRHTLVEAGGEDSDDDDYLLDDSLLDSLNLSGAAMQSTPKAKQPQENKDGHTGAQWADIESPFETLKKELTMKDYTMYGQPTSSTHSSPMLPPSTPPTNRARLNPRPPPGADPETPESSPFYPPQTTRKTPGGNPNEDALLHRVLDKNWRVQATPLGKQPASKYRTLTQATTTPKRNPLFGALDDESPMSSPPKPQFHNAYMFDSPPPRDPPRANLGPKTPTTAKQRYGGPSGTGGGAKNNDFTSKYNIDDWDEEDSDDLILPRGYSPPVTIQFSLPPSMLLATPAREASKRIVKDILMTAGAADESAATDSSPPMVRGRADDDSDDDMF